MKNIQFEEEFRSRAVFGEPVQPKLITFLAEKFNVSVLTAKKMSVFISLIFFGASLVIFYLVLADPVSDFEPSADDFLMMENMEEAEF